MNPTTAFWIVWIRRILTAALTTVAFLNSYAHTVDWFIDNQQAKSAEMLALLPEVGLIIVILTLVQGGLDRFTKVVVALIGLGSLAITLTANLSQAGPGVMGISAALVAPLFAVLGFTLEVRGLTTEVQPSSEPEQSLQINNLVQVQNVVSSDVVRTEVGVSSRWSPVRRSAYEWAVAQPEVTRVQLTEQFPELSAATAKRVMLDAQATVPS